MPLIDDVFDKVSFADILERLSKLETQVGVNADNIKTLFGIEDDDDESR